MKRSDRERKIAGEKFVGQVEVAAGKITGNERLELKGHVHVAKADVKRVLDPKRVLDDMKERVAGTINGRIDP